MYVIFTHHWPHQHLLFHRSRHNLNRPSGRAAAWLLIKPSLPASITARPDGRPHIHCCHWSMYGQLIVSLWSQRTKDTQVIFEPSHQRTLSILLYLLVLTFLSVLTSCRWLFLVNCWSGPWSDFALTALYKLTFLHYITLHLPGKKQQHCGFTEWVLLQTPM